MSGKTKIVPISESLALPLCISYVRSLTENGFIENHGSGTLRKAKMLGSAYISLYREERIAYDFGWEFRIAPNSRITYNDAVAEGDCHSVTEAQWFAERYMTLNRFTEDKWSFKYIIVEDVDGTRTEGIGLFCKQTCADYIGVGNSLYCIITEWDIEKKEWKDAKNPF